MIVQGSTNKLDGTCEVRVEWSDAERPDDRAIRAFAEGAAAAHNKGYDVSRPAIAACTLDGRDIPEGDDTTDANGARVSVGVHP